MRRRNHRVCVWFAPCHCSTVGFGVSAYKGGEAPFDEHILPCAVEIIVYASGSRHATAPLLDLEFRPTKEAKRRSLSIFFHAPSKSSCMRLVRAMPLLHCWIWSFGLQRRRSAVR